MFDKSDDPSWTSVKPAVGRPSGLKILTAFISRALKRNERDVQFRQILLKTIIKVSAVRKKICTAMRVITWCGIRYKFLRKHNQEQKHLV